MKDDHDKRPGDPRPIDPDKDNRIQIDKDFFEPPVAHMTGCELLELAGKKPPENFAIYLKVKGGQPERIGLDEKIDLGRPGVERFLTLPLDQTEGFGDRRDNDMFEKLVRLNRIAKVVKGGRRFSFSALVVVGDRKGRVGYGFGKANYVADAIRKSSERARRNMVAVPRRKTTLPHAVNGRFKGPNVLLRPAAPGTGMPKFIMLNIGCMDWGFISQLIRGVYQPGSASEVTGW